MSIHSEKKPRKRRLPMHTRYQIARSLMDKSQTGDLTAIFKVTQNCLTRANNEIVPFIKLLDRHYNQSKSNSEDSPNAIKGAGKFYKLNKIVYQIYKDIIAKGEAIKETRLKIIALSVADRLNIGKFRASNGWLDRFKTRNWISFSKKTLFKAFNEPNSEFKDFSVYRNNRFSSLGNLKTALMKNRQIGGVESVLRRSKRIKLRKGNSGVKFEDDILVKEDCNIVKSLNLEDENGLDEFLDDGNGFFDGLNDSIEKLGTVLRKDLPKCRNAFNLFKVKVDLAAGKKRTF